MILNMHIEIMRQLKLFNLLPLSSPNYLLSSCEYSSPLRCFIVEHKYVLIHRIAENERSLVAGVANSNSPD